MLTAHAIKKSLKRINSLTRVQSCLCSSVFAWQGGPGHSVNPHLVVAPAACLSWRTIQWGSALLKRGCTRSHGCCHAQSLHIAAGLCILETREVKLPDIQCNRSLTSWTSCLGLGIGCISRISSVLHHLKCIIFGHGLLTIQNKTSEVIKFCTEKLRWHFQQLSCNQHEVDLRYIKSGSRIKVRRCY